MHHRRRNPGAISTSLGNLKGLFYDSVSAIGGGIVTRSLPQAVLPNQNTGVLGYGLNILTAAIGSTVVTKFTKNARIGGMFLLGGIVMTVSRVIDDYFGAQLVTFAQFNPGGSPMLSGDSKFDYQVHKRLSGVYVDSTFPLPTNSLQLPAAAAAAPASVAANAMAGPWRGAWN